MAKTIAKIFIPIVFLVLLPVVMTWGLSAVDGGEGMFFRLLLTNEPRGFLPEADLKPVIEFKRAQNQAQVLMIGEYLTNNQREAAKLFALGVERWNPSIEGNKVDRKMAVSLWQQARWLGHDISSRTLGLIWYADDPEEWLLTSMVRFTWEKFSDAR